MNQVRRHKCSHLAALAVLAAVLVACTAAPDQPVATASPEPAAAEATTQLVSTDDFEGTIFSADRADQFVLGAFFPDEIEDYWTPAFADVVALESALTSYLGQAAQMSRPLTDYRRQYIGIMRNGRHEIYANYFCDTFDTNWQEELVDVADGGDCYFNLNYDLESGTFSRFSINGES